MESYWVAETLKYLYLIFEDFEVGSLDEWVYTTEAHLLRKGAAKEVVKGGAPVKTRPDGETSHDDIAAGIDAFAGGTKVGEKTSKVWTEVEDVQSAKEDAAAMKAANEALEAGPY